MVRIFRRRDDSKSSSPDRDPAQVAPAPQPAESDSSDAEDEAEIGSADDSADHDPDPDTSGARAESDYLTDAPIVAPEQDRFGRTPWALRVAETLAAQRDPASLVVGVYGPWGDGKMSALNLVFDTLAKTDGILPIRFNPWRLGDEAEMFHGFFFTLADALDEKLASGGERAGKVLRDYGGLFGFIPAAGDVLKTGAAVAGAKLSETNLAKQRKKVEHLLAKHGQRIVILIDDIDRLDKGEVQAMFRLVKVAADFRHTAYVMAFDHRVVATALAERYATDSAHGSSFMDKIIQLPLHLPPAPPERLRALTLETVDNALRQAGIALTEADAGAFVSVFDRAIGPRLTTPRAAKRYSNALLFAMPMIGEEVHPVDLMLIEAIRICFPVLYEWVRTHEHAVLGPQSGSGNQAGPLLSSIRDAVDLVAAGDDDAATRVRILLTTLFPRTESAWDNKRWAGEWDKTWTEEKRIASKLYFRRYFGYSVPPGDVADADVDALLTAVGAPEPDVGSVVGLALEVLRAEGADAVLQKLAARAPGLSSGAALNLSLVIALVSSGLPDQGQLFGLSMFDRSALLVRDLARQVDPAERGQLAAVLVADPYPAPFSIEVIRWLKPGKDEDAKSAVLNHEDADAAGRILAARLFDIWRTEDPFDKLARKAATALHVCSLYGDGDALRELLRQRITDDVGFSVGIMRSFLGQSWSMDTGEALVPRLHRETYEAMREYIEPSWLFPMLQERFGSDIGTHDVDFRPSTNDDRRIANEYAAYYLADLERAKEAEAPDDVDDSSAEHSNDA